MIKLFSDGADFEGIKRAAENPLIKGFTTNPTLMVKAGITDYEKFARDTIYWLASNRPDTCLSLEVFADTPTEMMEQARKIHSWADHNYPVYVKIPVTNTHGNYSHFITQLAAEGIKLNVTAILTEEQITYTYHSLNPKVPAIISIFAGRIYDTGEDALQIINSALCDLSRSPIDMIEFLWASPRQVYDFILAGQSGCNIITMTPELIAKLDLLDKRLEDYSLETVRMFYNSAKESNYKI